MSLATIRRPVEITTNDTVDLRRWAKHTTDNIDRINQLTTAEITSAELAATITDETGTGALVFESVLAPMKIYAHLNLGGF